MSNKAQLITAVLLAVLAVCAPARADEMADAKAFLADLGRVPPASATVDADRATLASDVLATVTGTALAGDVKQFFKDRKIVALLETAASVDRKILRLDDSFKGSKLVKPGPGTGTIPDANKFLTDYANWSALGTTVQTDVDNIQTAVTAGDAPGLTAALTAYFKDRHTRFQDLLDIVGDIHALKKDVNFKGTGKPVPPTGTTLAALVSTFVSDRATWVTQQTQLDSARSDIETAISANGDVPTAVTTFLTLRHQHFIQGCQLALDRWAMKVVIKVAGKEPLPTTPTSDIGPDSDGSLDQDDSTAGE